jgi:hypothetical protein
MFHFLAALAATPAGGLSPLCRYVVANGWFYLVVGLSLLALPTAVTEAAFLAELDGYEPGLVRVLGLTLAVIGWFYVMGGRTGATSFALATVVDRLLVPFVLFPLALTGAVPAAGVLPIAVIDPILALGALAIWHRQR